MRVKLWRLLVASIKQGVQSELAQGTDKWWYSMVFLLKS